MKVLAIVLSVAVAAYAQQCSLQGYMNCLDRHINVENRGQNARALDMEFREDSLALGDECFSSRDGGNLCYMEDQSDTIEQDGILSWLTSSGGPLASCSSCRTIARVALNLFKGAKAETLTCIRGVLNEGVGESITPCIQRKHPSYQPIDIPDFERVLAATNKSRVEAVETVVHVVVSKLALRNCLKRASRERQESGTGGPLERQAKATFECLKRREVNGVKIWESHCDIMKDCRSPFARQSCKSNFERVEATTCNCISSQSGEAKKVLSDSARKLVGALRSKPAPSNDELKNVCIEEINGVLDHYARKSIDINQYFEDAKSCVSRYETSVSESQLNSFTINKLVARGCSIFARRSNARAITEVINFGMQLFEALIERVQRFCPQAHCPINDEYTF